ncbi:MAG: ornithine cyclodeaminase family protein [Alcaligenaceae bacterium]|nr:ornithine cyclodeaminase family protein [Alcaligenaceae bacterium]
MSLQVYTATAEQVYGGLSLRDGIQLMRRAFLALADGKIDQPLRTIVKSPLSTGYLGLMPACVDDPGIYPTPVYGVKVGTLFPGNPALGKDPHQGCVMLMSGETGETLAVVDASSVTALRTAAVSGLAADLLARPDARVLTLFGAGHQAEWQLRAMAAVRPLEAVHVVSRHPDSARRFIERMQPEFPFALAAAADARSAVAQSDLVLTATNSAAPVLQRSWIRAGTHIVAMGSSTPSHYEIDADTMADARLFVDRAESTRNESGEYLGALRAGRIDAGKPLTELGAVLKGTEPGRRDAAEITLFKSLGLALEDVVVAAALRRLFDESGQGVCVEL